MKHKKEQKRPAVVLLLIALFSVCCGGFATLFGDYTLEYTDGGHNGTQQAIIRNSPWSLSLTTIPKAQAESANIKEIPWSPQNGPTVIYHNDGSTVLIISEEQVLDAAPTQKTHTRYNKNGDELWRLSMEANCTYTDEKYLFAQENIHLLVTDDAWQLQYDTLYNESLLRVDYIATRTVFGIVTQTIRDSIILTIDTQTGQIY